MATDTIHTPKPLTVDLTGLPDAIVQKVQRIVQEARKMQGQEVPSTNGKHPTIPPKNPLGLEQWEGTVFGTLSREEIYEDVG